MIHHARRFYGWFISLDLILLGGVLIAVGGLYGFAKLFSEMREGETQAFDQRIIAWVGTLHTSELTMEVGRDLTALGGIALLALMTAGVAGYLLICKKYHALLLLLAATVGALLWSTGLKYVIDRPRPELELHRSYVMTTSFPSGHAMLSAAVYLTLGSLLARLTKSPWLKLYYIGVAMLLTALVGISRVFLRVHWPTDVLAGWSVGLAWAIVCWAAARWLQNRGRVEPPQ
jgi:undecaprenyl-diphosphatase